MLFEERETCQRREEGSIRNSTLVRIKNQPAAEMFDIVESYMFSFQQLRAGESSHANRCSRDDGADSHASSASRRLHLSSAPTPAVCRRGVMLL